MIEVLALVLALVLGIALGTGMAIIPGMHPALVLTLVVGCGLPQALGPGPTVAFVAGVCGVVLYLRRLGAVYHVNAGEEQAATEPALRMTAAGQAATALRLMVLAVDVATGLVGAAAVVLLALSCGGINGAKALDGLMGPLGLGVIVLWAVTAIAKAKRKLLTVMGLGLMAVTGFALLHAPVLVGNPHQLAPLMTGVFAVPIAVSSWHLNASDFPDQQPHAPTTVRLELGLLGACVGMATGFFAGLGASSLVSLFESQAETNEDYLLVAAAAEAANDLMAVLLVLVAGMGRSGEAVILGRVSGTLTPGPAFLVFACVIVAALVGRQLVYALEPWYHDLVSRFSPRVFTAVVAVLALLQLAATGHFAVACAFTAAGACFSFWCRAVGLTQQVSFGCLALPLLAQSASLVPVLNAVIYP